MDSDTTSTKAGTILVVDDEEAVTGVIQAVLTKEGYQVHLAHNGEEGIKLASQVKPDLIIMDITMPGMDGYEATERIKQDPALADVPVIFLTGKSASEDGGKSFATGGVSFVRKPFTGQQLRDLVTLAMQSLNG
jgi:CheY-like chemotaxis protein